MKNLKVDFVNLGAQFQSLEKEILTKFSELSSKGAYILGSEVEQFEKSFAKYCDSQYSLAVANGTDALFLVMKAMGLGPGDEVITAPNSFIASAGAIVQIGARPVFCDVGMDYNIDPSKIESVITNRTKAILPVHLTGMPADMGSIMKISEKYNIPVIEDCAQAVGATFDGRKVGSFGLAGGFSLHPLKNLHVHGDGGVITTNDLELFEKLKILRNHGLINRDECHVFAINSRLDSIQAAIANIKMPKLDEYTKRFQEIAMMYYEGLKSKVEVPLLPPKRSGVFHNFVIMVDNRSLLQEKLLSVGIETKIHYPIPIHLQKAASFLGYTRGDFPIAEKQSERILSLPIYPELTDEQVYHVIESICLFT